MKEGLGDLRDSGTSSRVAAAVVLVVGGHSDTCAGQHLIIGDQLHTYWVGSNLDSWLYVMALPEVKASKQYRLSEGYVWNTHLSTKHFEIRNVEFTVQWLFFQLKELVLGLWGRHRLRIVLGVHLLLISWATLGRWSHMVKQYFDDGLISIYGETIPPISE